MAVTVEGSVADTVAWNWQDDQFILENTENDGSLSNVTSLESGTGDNQVNRVYAKQSTVAISGGTLVVNPFTGWPDFNGVSVGMTNIKFIHVELVSGPDTVTLTIGGALGTALLGGAGRIQTIYETGYVRYLIPIAGISLDASSTLTVTNASGTDPAIVNMVLLGVN